MSRFDDTTGELPPARGSFLGSVNIVMATYALDGLLALATGALIARELGADGRGAYGLFLLAAAFGQLVLGLGAGNAAVYYLNKRELSLRETVTAMHALVLGAAIVTALVVAATAPAWGDDIFGEDVPAWLLVLAVPAILHLNFMRLALQALGRFGDLGLATVGQQAVLLALVAIFSATSDATPADVVALLIVASVSAGAFALARVGVANVDPAGIARPRWRTIRALASFGLQGEAGNVLQLLNYRLDQYIVRGFVSLAGVGIYAVGVSMTEAIFVLANAVALVLMPRMTGADDEEVAWMAPVATRNTLLIAAGGALALAAIAPWLIPAVFGRAFDDSVEALWWLLPGAVALTGSKVLTSYIFSRGRPLVNTMITAVSLVVTVAANFALVPAFGVNGAAAASSLAYAAHFAPALFAYRRLSGQPVLGAVLPRPSDIGLYTDAARGVLARLARRASPQGAPNP